MHLSIRTYKDQTLNITHFLCPGEDSAAEQTMVWPYEYNPYLLTILATLLFLVFLGVHCLRNRTVPGAVPFIILIALTIPWLMANALRLSGTEEAVRIFWFKFETALVLPMASAGMCFILEYAGLSKMADPVDDRSAGNCRFDVCTPGFDKRDTSFCLEADFFLWRRYPSGVGTGALGSRRLRVRPEFGASDRAHLAFCAIAPASVDRCRAHHRADDDGAQGVPRTFRTTIPSNRSIPWSWPRTSRFCCMHSPSSPSHVRRRAGRTQYGDRSDDGGHDRPGCPKTHWRPRIKTAEAMLGLPRGKAIGRRVESALRDFPELLTIIRNPHAKQQEISFGIPHSRWYQASISPLTDRHGFLLGHLIWMQDTTEQKRLQEQNLDHQRTDAMLKERELLARELHDGIGQILAAAQLQNLLRKRAACQGGDGPGGVICSACPALFRKPRSLSVRICPASRSFRLRKIVIWMC